jgi:hypothetical protein
LDPLGLNAAVAPIITCLPLLPGLGKVFPPIQPKNPAIWQKKFAILWLFVVLVLETKTGSFCVIFAE